MITWTDLIILPVAISLGMMFGRPVEFMGGLVLIGIGVQVVVSHLSA